MSTHSTYAGRSMDELLAELDARGARSAFAKALDTYPQQTGRWIAVEVLVQTDAFGWTRCPEHGPREVVGTSVKHGIDAYEVEHLSCGHRVICFSASPDDVAIVGAR